MTKSFILATSHWISAEDGVAEVRQFSLLEKEEKHSERQAGWRGQSIIALLKVKNGAGGGGVHLLSRKKSK